MPKKVHTDIDDSVPDKRKHLRAALGENATFSDAVAHALSAQRNRIRLQLDKNAGPKAFFREKKSKVLPKEIRECRLNPASLLDLAVTITGRSSNSLLEEGITTVCAVAIVDYFRKQAGESNARGVSDEKILKAYESLIADGIIPTPSKIRDRSGTRLDAIKRWLYQNEKTQLPK